MTLAVIIGGIKSIGRAAEKLSPLKVGLYLLGGAIVIMMFIDRVPHVLSMVFTEALTTRSAMGFGMFVGDALRHRPRRLRQRSRLRHGRGRLRHGADRIGRRSRACRR